MSNEAQTDTRPDLPALPPRAAAPVPLDVEFGSRTHPGLVRPNNEDNFHIVRFGRYLRTVLSSLPDGDVPSEVTPPGHGFAVADGIGGQSAGEVASRAAISLLVEAALRTPDWILGWEDELLGTVMERTERRFRLVGEAIRDQAEGRPELKNMGTTLSLALSLFDALIVAHVGDSPVFLFRDSRLLRLTRDHTVGQELDDRGYTTANHFRHVLTRCIGGAGSGGRPDVASHRLADGDRLLLCTDGLTDMVDDDSIARELGRGSPSDETCRALVELALDRGGRDNVTVVVASYRRP